jgi:hypothetical protein
LAEAAVAADRGQVVAGGEGGGGGVGYEAGGVVVVLVLLGFVAVRIVGILFG